MQKLSPAQIVEELRKIAQDIEDSERMPASGISMCPKEETVEWMAADLLDERLEELRAYENFFFAILELKKNTRDLSRQLKTALKGLGKDLDAI